MKHLKIILLTIVALSTLGFTVASNEGIFKLTKALGDCYSNVVTPGLFFNDTWNSQDNCEDVPNLINRCVFNASTFISSAADPKAVGQACDCHPDYK